MTRYASNTTVNVDRSKAEIESILRRYGASGFGYYTKDDKAVVQFEFDKRLYQITVPLPLISSFDRTEGRGRPRSMEKKLKMQEQASRQRWRAICLILKAKLEAIELLLSTIEAEFMPYLLLPASGGRPSETLTDRILPALKIAQETGRPLNFLPEPEKKPHA